jgi:hypothetical protein
MKFIRRVSALLLLLLVTTVAMCQAPPQVASLPVHFPVHA